MSNLRFIVGVCSLILVGAIESSARADVMTGTASAFGVQSSVAVSSPVGNASTSFPSDPSVSGAAPPAFSLNDNAFSSGVFASFGPMGFASATGQVSNVTADSDVNGLPGTRTSTATAYDGTGGFLLSDPLLGFGLIDIFVTGVFTQSQVTGDTGSLVPTGSTIISTGDFQILGFDLTPIIFPGGFPVTIPGPNTTFTITDANLGGTNAFSGSITVVLDEQIITGNGTTISSIIENALDVTFNNFTLLSYSNVPVTLDGGFIVAHTQSSLVATAPAGGGAQPVPEPSSIALCAVLGVAGAVARFKRRRAERRLESV